jgi:hypothetical protein
MSVWQQQMVDQLKQRLSHQLARRGELEAARKAHTDGAAEQIKRLDADIERVSRDLYAAEYRLRQT